MRSLATGLVAISELPQTTNTGTLIVASVSVSSNLNIASLPRARTPGELNADKNAAYSQMIAKNTEDPYQSAFWLKYDLETCLHQLQQTGKIESFPIGQRLLRDAKTVL